jgi:hypothetical protein
VFLEALGSPVQVRGVVPEAFANAASRPLENPEAEEGLQVAVKGNWERA